MCSSSSPPPPPAAPAAPDYTGAALATAAGNKDAAIAAQRGSMINQYTPYGNLTYSDAGRDSFGNPIYNSNITLNGAGQQMLDQQNKLGTGLFSAQDKSLGQVNAQGTPDLNSVQSVADKAYSNYTSRLDPQWAHQQEMTDTALRNQGLTPGTEAYDNAMRDFNYAKNDAYTQATTAAINTMPQTYQLAQAQFDQPLNRLNALRTGSQVTNPQFTNANPGQQTVPGADYLRAAGMQGQFDQGLYGQQVDMYNAQQAGNNSFTSGLMGLAGTLGAAWLKSP